MKLGVCVPWASPFAWLRFTETALNLRHPEGVEVKWFFGRGWCAANRHNTALMEAHAWGAELFCILGADQTYEPDMFCRLVDRVLQGHEVVTALVPIRGHVPGQGTKPFQAAAFRLKDSDRKIDLTAPLGAEDFDAIDPSEGDIQQVHMIGSGVMMLRRGHLDAIKQPWFFEAPNGGPAFNRVGCTDVPFTWRLQQEAGATIWCDTTINVRHLHAFEIDETFGDRFADWADKSPGNDLVDRRPLPDPKLIQQMRVSKSTPFFQGLLQRKYGLTDYIAGRRPAFFWGCYSAEDMRAIQAHKERVVLVWGGSDLLRLMGNFPSFLRDEKIAHVAASKFIARDLEELGLEYHWLNFNIADPQMFQPCPPGKKVYAYLPDREDGDVYGSKLTHEVQAAMPDVEFVITKGIQHLPRNKMPDVYRECGVGVRFTPHDGLANTVVEMGMMGRPVLWNGGMYANSIPYDPENIPEICAAIRKALNEKHDWRHIGETVSKQDKPKDGWNRIDTYFPALKLVNA